MILECNQPFAMNFTDLVFLGNYQKSKKKSNDICDIRFLFKEISTGKERLWMFEKAKDEYDFRGNKLDIIQPRNLVSFDRPEPNKLSNGKYKYYYINDDPKLFTKVLEMWKNSNPMVSIGGCWRNLHQKMDKVINYTYAYKWDGKEY